MSRWHRTYFVLQGTVRTARDWMNVGFRSAAMIAVTPKHFRQSFTQTNILVLPRIT
jgi:hypothetical protein